MVNRYISKELRGIAAFFIGIFGISIAVGGLLYSFSISKEYSDIVYWGYKGFLSMVIVALGCFCFGFSIIRSVLAIVKLVDSRFLLEQRIYPWPMELEDLRIEPSSSRDGAIVKADDEEIVINYGNRKYPLVLGGGFTIFLLLIFRSIIAKNAEFSGGDGMGFLSLIISFVALTYGIFFPKRQFIFNRTNRLVTIPGPLWFPSATISFKKVRPGVVGKFMGFVHPYSGMISSIGEEYGTDVWGFFVQYMDKNWPLPCGNAFDPYREKDFLRRKAAGFPKPTTINDIHLTDFANNYVYGTEAFKEKLKDFKVPFINAYAYVHEYVVEENYTPVKVFADDNDLALVGIYENSYVFKMYYPQNTEYVILDKIPEDCFLVYGVKKGKKQSWSSMVTEHGVGFERKEEWLLPEDMRG